MRKALVIVAAALALVAALQMTGCAPSAPTTQQSKTPSDSNSNSPSNSGTATPRVWNETVLGTAIDIADSTVTPGRVYIKTGASVTWVNHDRFRHKILIDAWNLSSGTVIPPGGRYSQKFVEAGTYAYHDAFYPVMGGEIVVQ